MRPHWHTALKRQNMPAEGVGGETDRGEPIDSLAERGQVAQKGAVRQNQPMRATAACAGFWKWNALPLAVRRAICDRRGDEGRLHPLFYSISTLRLMSS